MFWIIFILMMGNALPSARASLSGAAGLLENGRGETSRYADIAAELMEDGYYYAAFPFVRAAIERGESGRKARMEALINELVAELGTRIFEKLPAGTLLNSSLASSKYFLGRHYFQKKKYAQALELLAKIPDSHPLRPFVLSLEANALSVLGKHQSALLKYEECVDDSQKYIGNSDNSSRTYQLKLNRDYCLIGIPRTLFAMGSFEKADLKYLDLPKSSPVWPEILFEEAWNSFYLKNFNRTLGKLSTYKSPFLEFIFNPEADVLRAFSYLELCLYGDARREADDFYSRHQKDFLKLKRVLLETTKPELFYFKLATSRMKGMVLENSVLNHILKSITASASFRDLVRSFDEGKDELMEIQKMRKSGAKIRGSSRGDAVYKVLLKNQLEVLELQRAIIGDFVHKMIVTRLTQMEKAFEQMSYIKLEVLQRKKESILTGGDSENRERGDIEFLPRNEKQYFWDFNGEFWADELGDYVFALPSEC